jgi:TctA family transporter
LSLQSNLHAVGGGNSAGIGTGDGLSRGCSIVNSITIGESTVTVSGGYAGSALGVGLVGGFVGGIVLTGIVNFQCESVLDSAIDASNVSFVNACFLALRIRVISLLCHRT